MKKVLFLSLLMMLVGVCTVSAGKKQKKEYKYEIVPMGVGSQGSALIKVYSYAKNQKQAIELAKENAVHGILFKGVAGSSGTAAQPALVKPQDHEAHLDFFERFFEEGTYLRYVSLSSDGTVSSDDRLKVGNQYKIGIVVSVNKADLRKYLEEEGVIRKFGGGIF